ncbi:MAG: energy transducer TonB [Bacteroidia bacterium]
MRQLLFSLTLVFSFHFSFAQKNEFENILNSDKLEIEHYSKADLKSNQLYLESPFAKGELKSNPDFEKIKDYIIYRVDLVYTTYHESQSFNQKELNRQRIAGLKKLAPQFFNVPLIAWGQIAITGAHNPAEGKEMFHGFIFTYREPSTKLSRSEEINFIKELLGDSSAKKTAVAESEKKIRNVRLPVYKKRFYDELEFPQFVGGDSALREYLQKHIKYPKDAFRDHKEGEVQVSFIVNSHGEVEKVSLISGIDESCNNVAMKAVEKMPKWITGKRNGKPAGMRYTLPIKFIWPDKVVQNDVALLTGVTREYKTRGRHEELIVDSIDAPEAYYKFIEEQDSSVFKILNRNNWKNTLFVCDVTGSMSPYTSQLLLWFRLNLTQGLVKQFFFFNDGNNMNDMKKEIGRTGGIYHASTDDFTMVANTLYEAMTNGAGGDVPENDLEAIIEAIKLYPEYDNVVLIADNFATPRDLNLISKINKPIKVILCGTYSGLNTNYMDMVRANKGSLHTIEEDITNLVNLNEGEEINISGQTYKIHNGKFERMQKL